MNEEIAAIPLYLWILVPAILLIQGTWMFLDARKNGHNYWLWGILGLIQFPTYLLIYLFYSRKISRKNKIRI